MDNISFFTFQGNDGTFSQIFFQLLSNSSTKITLLIYSWQKGEKTNGFWLELFIGQVPAVSARLYTMQ